MANEANIWVEFHRFWMRKRFECPILIVRYEDIMLDKEVYFVMAVAYEMY